MKLDKVTITGADDSVKPEELVKLTEKYSFVEWAILVSKSQMGSNRFPSSAWMNELISLNLPVSLHVCGAWVKLITSGVFPDELPDLYFHSQRMQLNFHAEKMFFSQAFIDNFSANIVKKSRAIGLSTYTRMFTSNIQTIIQMDDVNNYVIHELLYNGANVVPLFDLSHGAGVLPKAWPKPISGVYNGFAGGLGPNNLDEQIPKIAEAAGDERFWIDMETKVRSDNDCQFDLYKVEQCLDISGKYINESK